MDGMDHEREELEGNHKTARRSLTSQPHSTALVLLEFSPEHKDSLALC